MGSTRDGIPGLTGLRAVMGTWVVADHLREPIIGLLPRLAPLAPLLSGGIALDTFFILSGFVISHVYGTRLSRPDRRAYGAFLWARAARLWPMHVFALGVTAALMAVLAARGVVPDHPSAASFVANLALLQAVPGVEPWNGPSWAVSTEMAAYLLFPVVAALVARARRAGAVALAALVVGAEIVVLPHLAAGSPTTVLWSLLWVRPLGEFALGCALWAAWRHGLRRHWTWDLVAVAALGGVAAIMYVEPFGADVLDLYAGPAGATRVLAVALLGVVVVAATGAAGPLRWLLAARPVQWAGRTSYSRYLLHLPALAALQLVFPFGATAGAAPTVRVAAVASWFVVVFVVGGLAHRYVEEPARRRLRALGPGRRSGAERRRADGEDQTPAGTLTPS